MGPLAIIFVVVPAIEIYLLLEIGGFFGPLPTFGLILFTGILGAHLSRQQGLQVLRNIQSEANQGRVPAEGLMDGLMVLIAGVLLLTPGFLTDILGFSTLVPAFRKHLRKAIADRIVVQMPGQLGGMPPFGGPFGGAPGPGPFGGPQGPAGGDFRAPKSTPSAPEYDPDLGHGRVFDAQGKQIGGKAEEP